MLTHKSLILLGQTDRILNNRPKGEGAAAVLFKADNLGNKGSGPPVKG